MSKMQEYLEKVYLEKKLTTKERKGLSDEDFAIVKGSGEDKERNYPIPDVKHARNALARVGQH